MANDITGNPYILDTAGTIVSASTNVLVNTVVWMNPATAGDQIIVQDGNGHEIWNLTALAGGTGVYYVLPAGDFTIPGLIVDTIDSGELWVYQPGSEISTSAQLYVIIRDAIHDDPSVQNWCTANYSRNHKVYGGFDERNPPDTSAAPLVSIFDPGKEVGQNDESIRHTFGIMCELYDESTRATGKTNVVEYTGVQNIEVFRKLVETAIYSNLPANTVISSISIALNVVALFPWFQALMMLELEQDLYQGDDFLA